MPDHRPLTVFAPAKVNLYLHVTGKRDDGYHLLDSLIVFADIGDKIMIESANDFSFQINGPYASAFTSKDRDDSSTSSNLVVRAAWALSRATGRDLPYRVTLTKNLPLASGIGGGSSDAAALIWGLMAHWGISMSASVWLPGLLMELGAELPACLRCVPVRVTGVGDIFDEVQGLPEIPIVLINPGKHCPTPDAFRRFMGPMRQQITMPSDLSSPQSLIDFLHHQENDLTNAACEIVPEIADAIRATQAQAGCQIARMSGSGASVFGLFGTLEQAQDAVEKIIATNPSWWVRAGTINSPQRY